MTVFDQQVTSLTPAQEGQWEVMYALCPDDPARTRHLVFDYRHLQGAVDERAFMDAFADVTRRHDALRVVFDSVSCDPVIRVEEDAEPAVEFIDLTGLSDRAQRNRIEEVVFDEGRRCFDLRKGPLWHASVLRLNATSHWLVLSLSHIVADGWSSKIFVDDLLAAYRSRTGNGPPLIDDVPALAEIHDIQRRRLDPLPERLRYWRECLTALPDEPYLFRPRVAEADLLTQSVVTFAIPAPTVAGVKRVAWKARTTDFVTLLSAYHLLLAIATGKSRTVVSTAALSGVTGRERRAICQHANDPYISTDLTDDRTLLDAVRRTHTSMAGALEHLVSYKDVARAVNPDFERVRPWPDCHLFDGNFFDGAFEPAELTTSDLRLVRPPLHLDGPPSTYTPDLLWSALPPSAHRIWEANCGPNMEVNTRRDGGALHFNRELLPTELMREFVDRYLWVVGAIADTPELTVGALRDKHAQAFPS